MNPIKTFTIIFSLLSILAFACLAIYVTPKIAISSNIQFFEAEGNNYVNYYLKRSNFRFKQTLNSFIIEKVGVGTAEFSKDTHLDKFLTNWSVYEGLMFPNSDCEYIRVSIPANSKSLKSGNILFSCVNSYINDQLNLEHVQ